jgi:hypothetical protein
MKLTNYFYLSGEETAYSAFRDKIPDSAVMRLVKDCLREIAPDVQICEWFPVERRTSQISESNMPTIAANICISSSGDPKPFLGQSVTDTSSLATGLGAIARPHIMHVWVDL